MKAHHLRMSALAAVTFATAATVAAPPSSAVTHKPGDDVCRKTHVSHLSNGLDLRARICSSASVSHVKGDRTPYSRTYSVDVDTATPVNDTWKGAVTAKFVSRKMATSRATRTRFDGMKFTSQPDCGFSYNSTFQWDSSSYAAFHFDLVVTLTYRGTKDTFKVSTPSITNNVS